MINLTSTQLENIQINEGIVYANYGELTEKLIAPTRGGGEFVVTEVYRDIEFDGRKGKTKDMRAIEEINAMLKVTTLGVDQATIKLALTGSGTSGDAITSGNVGLIASAKYLTNVTMFAKTTKGEYKKITIYSALADNDFSLNAQPKAEGEIELEFSAHWDATDDTKLLYKIEDVTTFPETPVSA